MKKRLSLLLSVVMLLSMFVPALSVSAEKARFSDVEDSHPYKAAITTLSILDVINGYEDGTFAPDKEISRAEFTKMIVCMLGYGDFASVITQFNDVAPDHWANSYIKTAYDLGIVNGFDETTFKPDDPVTYEQALKMVVCTLGYQTYAEAMGGYPTGYRFQAESIKITKDVTGVAYTDNASRGVISQIMYNALEVDKFELVNGIWQSTGKTLLNDFLKVYTLKGVVVGVEDSTTADCDNTLSRYTMAVDESTTGKEHVIDFEQYNPQASALASYLGQTVQIYYRQDDLSGQKWLIDITGELHKNTELELRSSQISSFKSGVLKYYEDGASVAKSINLDMSKLTVRYNGRVVDEDVEIDGEDYTPARALEHWLTASDEDSIYGSVKLINNGSSNAFNYVDIYDYEAVVAYKAPSVEDYRIVDKTVQNNSLTLDPDSDDYEFTILKGGNEITTTQIVAGDVVNYALNLDEDVYTVYVTSETVSGRLSAVNTASTTNKSITINDKKYSVTDRFIEYMENVEKRELTPGMQITAHLDVLGAVEWASVTASEGYYPYAYVIDAQSEGEECFLKLFAPTSTSITSLSSSTAYKVKTYKISESAKLNGTKTSPDSIKIALKETAERNNPDDEITSRVELTGYNQLVRVKFNSSNEIADIVTISDSEGRENSDQSSLVRYSAVDPDNEYYISSSSVKTSRNGSNLYSIKTSIPMFVIPEDRTDTDDYALKPAIGSNSMSYEGSYYIEAFDVNSSKYPTCILIYCSSLKSGTEIEWTTPFRLLAEESFEAVDSNDGSIYTYLNTFTQATSLSKISIASKAEDDFEDLGVGDIFLCGFDGDNRADKLMIVQDYDEIERILDGERVGGQIYNWTEGGGSDYHESLFNWKWASTDNENVSYTRSCMFNLLQLVSEDDLMYVSQEGFDPSDESYDDTSYETIRYDSNTKVIRYDSVEKEFTPYAAGSESFLTVENLREAKYDGANCSKIMVVYQQGSSENVTPTAKFIVAYQ